MLKLNSQNAQDSWKWKSTEGEKSYIQTKSFTLNKGHLRAIQKKNKNTFIFDSTATNTLNEKSFLRHSIFFKTALEPVIFKLSTSWRTWQALWIKTTENKHSPRVHKIFLSTNTNIKQFWVQIPLQMKRQTEHSDKAPLRLTLHHNHCLRLRNKGSFRFGQWIRWSIN